MMQRLVFACLCLVVISLDAVSLPSGIKTCKQSDANHETCLLKAVEDSIKFLKKGNKAIGLPSIDPIFIKTIHIAGNGGQVDIDQTYTDLNIYGMTDAVYTNAKINIDGDNCDIHLTNMSPHVELIGDFAVKGRLLLFTLGGQGPANITIVNLKTNMDFTCKKVEKKGKPYLEITGAKIELIPELCIFDIKNLVDGNELLSATILKVMNDNNQEIFSELKKDYENAIQEIIQQLATIVFRKISSDQIFLP